MLTILSRVLGFDRVDLLFVGAVQRHELFRTKATRWAASESIDDQGGERKMNLGEHYPCLNVRDLQRSIEFYQKLGFKIVEDHQSENWAVLQHNNIALCLYQGHIDNNLSNFRGGDIEAIHEEAAARGLGFSKPPHRHADGSWSAEVRDPGGNVIFFNTSPDEREQYVRTVRLIAY